MTDPFPFEADLPIDPKVHIGDLASGLRYYVRENHRPENRAELWLVVRAGSSLETEEQRGLAHIVEHMAFNGTSRFGARELVSYFESIGAKFGAHLNAHTSFDETVYKLQIPMDDPEIVEKAFWILRDWASELSFLPEEIERERKVGLEELRQSRGASSRIRDQILPLLFKGSVYADRLPIGTENALLNFKHESLVKFYKDWYRPELMAIIMVGDFDADLMIESLHRHFDDLRPSPESFSRPENSVPIQAETMVMRIVDSEIPQDSFTLFSKVHEPPSKSLMDYRQGIVFELSVQAFNERLVELGQEKGAPFLSARVGRQPLTKTFSVDAMTCLIPEGGHRLCLEAMIAQRRRLATHGITPGELRRAKLRYQASIDAAYDERDTTSSRTLVQELTRAFTIDEPIPGIEFEQKMVTSVLEGIDLETVNAALLEWLSSPSQIYHLISGSQDSPSEDELYQWITEASSLAVLPPPIDVLQSPLIRNLPKGGSVEKRIVLDEHGLVRFDLSGGSRLFFKPTDFQSDRILYRSIANGGLSLASDADLVSAQVAGQIAFRSGAGEHSLISLQQILSGVKMGLNPRILPLSHGFKGMCAQADAEKMFQLAHLFMHEPRFDEEAFHRELEVRSASLRNKDVDPGVLFMDTFHRLWWCDHFRHRPQTLADLERLNLDASRRFFQHVMASKGAFDHILVGNLKTEEVLGLVETYLCDHQEAHRLSIEKLPRHGDDRIQGVVRDVVYAGTEPLARFQMRCIARRNHNLEERVGMKALTALLQIFLRRSLREDRGDIYAVSVNCRDTVYPSYSMQISLAFAADPDKIDPLVDESLRIMDKLRREPVSYADLSIAQTQLLRTHETQLRDNASWMNHLVGALRTGVDPASIHAFPSMVQAITPSSLQDLADRFVDLDNRLELTLLPVS